MAQSKRILEKQFIYKMNSINLKEFSEIFKYVIQNNRNLIDSGKNAVTIGIEGVAGLGKTSIIQQLAKELDCEFVKINLAELEEVSDLTGFPVKEFEAVKNDSDLEWIPADLLQTYTCNECYRFTGNTRMSYATPAWLPRDCGDKGVILALDDYSRANSLFMQACMELINTGKYVSWSLPKYTNIVLTANPDNGSYSVSSLDSAQKSRFINFNVQFDIDCFAEWAENYGLDNKCINFAIYYHNELFNPNHTNHLDTINPRSYTTFSNVISGIKDWNKAENLALILNISKGCFHDEDNVVGNLFTNFIANKLDKLVTPEDMLTKDWDKVLEELKNCVYDNGQYHPEIAAILHTRLLNYCNIFLSKTGSKTQLVIDRLTEFAEQSKEEDKIFSEDLLFSMIKTLIAKHKNRLNKMLMNPSIRSKII